MRYKHIAQKPYCCVAACIQMLLQRRKMQILTQEEIAYDLGVVLPPAERHLLPRSYKAPRPKSGWGTRIQLPRYSLAGFFRRHTYALDEQYLTAKAFRSLPAFKSFLREHLKGDDDLLTCFNYPQLYGLKGSWGHASLIEKFEGSDIFLRDPDPGQPKLRKVKASKLFAAMQGFSGRGVWVVGAKQPNKT